MNKNRRRSLMLLTGLVMAVSMLAATATAQPVSLPQSPQSRGFDYHVIGDVDEYGLPIDVAVPTPSSQALALEGGDALVKEALTWLVSKSGGGNVLVLRASGGDWYNRTIWQQIGGVASVETIVTRTREAAHDPFVLDRIAKADLIYISGGNQADYVWLWQDTPLQRAINDAVRERRVPIGGISAGMMILGQFAFSAITGSVGSAEVEGRPDHADIALVRNLLSVPGMAHTITDSHFDTRDRLGRLAMFMARTVIDGWTRADEARAIGVGGRAALLVEDGIARVVGEGAVHLLRPQDTRTSFCGDSTLPFRSVRVHRVDTRSAFDLNSWRPHAEAASSSYDVSFGRCDGRVALGRGRGRTQY